METLQGEFLLHYQFVTTQYRFELSLVIPTKNLKFPLLIRSDPDLTRPFYGSLLEIGVYFLKVKF